MPSLSQRRLWINLLGSCGDFQNIIPASTGNANAVDKIMPELNRMLSGMKLCVSTLRVSIVDLECCLEKAIKYDDIEKVLKQASEGPLKGTLDCTEDQVFLMQL